MLCLIKYYATEISVFNYYRVHVATVLRYFTAHHVRTCLELVQYFTLFITH